MSHFPGRWNREIQFQSKRRADDSGPLLSKHSWEQSFLLKCPGRKGYVFGIKENSENQYGFSRSDFPDAIMSAPWLDSKSLVGARNELLREESDFAAVYLGSYKFQGRRRMTFSSNFLERRFEASEKRCHGNFWCLCFYTEQPVSMRKDIKRTQTTQDFTFLDIPPQRPGEYVLFIFTMALIPRMFYPTHWISQQMFSPTHWNL